MNKNNSNFGQKRRLAKAKKEISSCLNLIKQLNIIYDFEKAAKDDIRFYNALRNLVVEYARLKGMQFDQAIKELSKVFKRELEENNVKYIKSLWDEVKNAPPKKYQKTPKEIEKISIIELGKSEVALNETFTIKITVSGEKIRSYDQFPEINGFQKQGLSQNSSTQIINGQINITNSMIQHYKPLRKGQFTLPPFTLTVNGESISSSGKCITVNDSVNIKLRIDINKDKYSNIKQKKQELNKKSVTYCSLCKYKFKTDHCFCPNCGLDLR
jgi:hypothetical protein